MRAVLSHVITLGLVLTPFVGCQKKVRFSGETAQNSDNNTQSTSPNTSTNTTTVPACQQVEKLVGAHFFIAMDNSRSMIDTDCQQITGSNYTCAETTRERSVKAVMDGLVQMSLAHPGHAESVSSLALGRFTVHDVAGSVDFSRDVLFGPQEAINGSQTALVNAMTVLRNPDGDTPYLNAYTLFDYFNKQVSSQYGNDGKARVAILITDGEATDRNPQLVRQSFDALKANGVKVFTLMLTNGSTRAARLPEHQQAMQSYNTYYAQPQGTTWWDPRSYNNFTTYFTDLVSLPDQISQKVVELPSVQNLTDAIFKEVIAKEIKCQ